MKIDKALQASLPETSRRKIRRCLDESLVSLNGQIVRVASRTVRENDIVIIYLDDLNSNKKPPVFSAEHIIYWHEGLIAINKAPGISSSLTKSQKTISIKDWIYPFFEKKEICIDDVRLCHRLDLETTGLLLLATDKEVYNKISYQLKNRLIKKEYHAIVAGIPKNRSWEVECNLSSINRQTKSVNKLESGGKYSLTKFKCIASSKENQVSLIKAFPKTGRSHQIRVHLKLSGHPIIGDKKYLNQNKTQNLKLKELSTKHHFLHAYSLNLEHPKTQKEIEVVAEIPPNFREFCNLSKLFKI